MENTTYIQGFHSLMTEPLEDKALRLQPKQAGVEGRRMSRFSQLALLGALPLKEHIQPDTAIYLASSFASPSKFNKMFWQVNDQQCPSPLDFMANLNNAATFHLAQQLATQGSTIFLAVNQINYWQPLKLALMDLQQNPNGTNLVGWAFEHYQQGQIEGSCWLLLSKKSENAIAKLNWQKLTALSHNEQFLQPLHNIMELM